MTTKEYLQQAYRLDKRINSHIREKEELKNAIPAHPVLFDISIFDGEKEIEPAEGSSVQVEIKLAKDSVSGLFTDEESPLLINEEPVKATGNELTRKLQIIHDVKEESLEVVDVREKDSEEKITGQFVTESFSNWLLFLDEEVTSIDVYQGDSITLRPYGKWFWKYNDPTNTLSDVSWSFPASQYDVTEDWTQVDVDYNGGKEWRYGITQAKTKNGLYTIYGTAKYDRELKEDYRFFNIYLPDNAPLDGFNLYTSNGKTIRVNVLPKPQTPVTTPPEIQGLTNIKVNLFDYDLGGTLDYGWENGGSNKNLSNRYPTPFTNTINNNSNGPLKFLSSGSGTTQGNYVNYYRGSIPNTGIVDTRLGTDHFPKLAYNRDNQQHSLKYLFDTSKTSVSNWQTYKDIIAYPNVTGLFQKDTDGYYYYNSNSNYYYYDTSTKTSHLYSRTYSQDTEGTGGHNAKPMGFFPFHPYNSTDSNHLYVNQNTVLNHHFGMSMEVTFALPADKKLENSKDIIYDFSGDDDLWVFIDDDLALDIGGIHQPVRGYINFTTGKVYVYGTNNNNEKEVSFIKNMEPGKEYTLRMFYLERGGCDSNLSVKFNIPLTIGKGDFKVIKKGENNINLQGAKFGLWENKECQGNPLRTSTSGSNGIVSFENLPVKEPGQEYYMEEMAAPTGYIKSAKKYIVKASDAPGTDGKFVFSIYEMNEDGTIGNELTKMEEQPRLPIIVNKKQVKKSLSLEKSWQDEFGLALVPSNVSATFVLHKVGYVANFITSQNQPYTVILQNPKGESLATGIFYENDKIRLLYEFDSNSVSTKMTRKQGDSFIDYAMLSSGSNKYVDYTVDASHADAQNQIIFRRENDANGKSHGFKSGLRWALQPGETSHDADTTQISGTVDQTTTFTLPENGDWTKTFTNQDTYDDNLEPFKYWFEEISCTAEGYIPMTSTGADAPIGEGNSQAIKNVKPASIKIIKVVMGTETPISGAGFTLTQVDDSGREIPDGIKKEQQLTDDDGVLVFDELVPGRYKLEESKVPDGYIKNEGAYFIIVNDDYTTKLIDGNEYTLITKSDTGASVYYVQNELGAALPSTGGLGTSMFYLLGITLIGLAVAGLVLKKAVIT